MDMKIKSNPNIVFPDYNHSILGTITSILKYYNVNTTHKSSEILDKILKEKEYKNVILLIMDGMGESIIEKTAPEGYLKKNIIDIVTSVYPSTTTAAMTTYYSGKTPYETGWIAWSQYFKEYGRSLDLLTHKETYYNESLKKPIIDVYEKFLKYDSIFDMIEKSETNIKTYEIKPEYAERKCKRVLCADDFFEVVEHIENIVKVPDKKFVFAYCDNPDSILHKYGTDSIEVKNFILEIDDEIKKLSNKLENDTLLIISADHGHKDIEKSYSLWDYPEIQECLIMPPSLESRVVSFWIKNDMKEVFKERFNNIFGTEFLLVEKNDFIEKYKFLGSGVKNLKIDDFIGDYVAISIKNSIIKIDNLLVEAKTVKQSTHCGLTNEEMQVPIIIIKK